MRRGDLDGCAWNCIRPLPLFAIHPAVDQLQTLSCGAGQAVLVQERGEVDLRVAELREEYDPLVVPLADRATRLLDQAKEPCGFGVRTRRRNVRSRGELLQDLELLIG